MDPEWIAQKRADAAMAFEDADKRNDEKNFFNMAKQLAEEEAERIRLALLDRERARAMAEEFKPFADMYEKMQAAREEEMIRVYAPDLREIGAIAECAAKRLKNCNQPVLAALLLRDLTDIERYVAALTHEVNAGSPPP